MYNNKIKMYKCGWGFLKGFYNEANLITMYMYLDIRFMPMQPTKLSGCSVRIYHSPAID